MAFFGESGSSPPAVSLLTLPEAAAVLRIAPRTLSRLVKHGRVPHIGRHRLLRFRREELLSLPALPSRTEMEAVEHRHRVRQ